MIDRRILLAALLSMVTVLALNYFSPTVKQPVGVPDAVVPGTAYKVPTKEELAKPINRDVSFVETKRSQEEVITKVETERYSASFSTFGGVLSSLEFKKHTGANMVPLKTVHYRTFYEQDQGAFLLAFDQKTPYFYQFVGKVENADSFILTYQTEYEGWSIKKIYTIPKDSYQVTLALEYAPLSLPVVHTLHPRLLFPAPFTPEVPADIQDGVVANVSGQVDKVGQGNEMAQAWVMPSIIGAESKYFAHLLVKDPEHFVQRAYYKKEDKKPLCTIVEGPTIDATQKYELSFYCGPKLLDELTKVDERLEGLLQFGWLSAICKFLLKLLKHLYSFFKNYGIAIIVLTILVRIPFLPLTMTAKRKMEQFQRYQPSINKIRQKYKDDLKTQHAEMMRFYKEHNISPTASLMGCLPFMLQIPILFALYRVLSNYVELYHAPFFGWITDLSAKDPYYILPILMGGSMLWQQKMSPVTDDRQRVTMMFMTLLFTALFIGFPAGLVLYWAINNLLSVGEDYLRKLMVK